MASLTRDEIVAEGMRLAGRDPENTGEQLLAVGWLQRWLNSRVAAWSWPTLRQLTFLPVAQGAAFLQIGGTGSTITNTVVDILDGIWMYTPDNRQPLFRLPIRNQLGAPSGLVGADSLRRGWPTSVQLVKNPDFAGGWRAVFDVPTDKAYSLSLTLIIQPANLTSGTAKPWYENDETMVQAVAFKCHEYYDGKDSPLTQAAQQQLASLGMDDKQRYGRAPGIGSKMALNPSTFKQRRY
ncbi:MAG: hypothetical protein QM729_21480 [Solirubrobacterales bacterium]